MTLDTLKDLFVDQLRDVYGAETQLAESLPILIEAANSRMLASALALHLAETDSQVMRLDRVFAIAGEAPGSNLRTGIAGLIEAGEEAATRRG